MSVQIENIALNGGWLCLDFINTVSPRNTSAKEEHLKTWDDLLRWSRRLGLLRELEFELLQSFPQGDILEAHSLREVLFELFDHQILHGKIAPEHLEKLNGLLHEAYTHTALQETPEGLRREVEPDIFPEKPLWQIALSAEALLLSGKLNRVKACNGCGWLFLDTSKNATRRWCDMAVCGSQIKSKAYYHRKKAPMPPPETNEN